MDDQSGAAARPDTNTPTPAADLERQRLISLINTMADAVVAIDQEQRIVLSNAAALDILDSNSQLDGKLLTNVLAPKDASNNPVDVSAVVRECKTQYATRDWKLYYSDEDSVSLYVSIAAVQVGFGEGSNSGWVIVLRDITREKSLEEERDEFISVVSHELRTPIAITEGNIGNAEYVFQKSGLQSPEIGQALKEAHDQVNFLSGMINDLATLSRAERGKLQVEIESINPHEFCEVLARNYQTSAAAKNLRLNLDLDPSLELLQTSKLYLREILQNFITNAIKYTQKGSVTLAARNIANGIEFSVIDTGIGISKSDQRRIFDKFFRSEDFHTRAENGTGLGLYVTMKLTRLIHAQIRLESSPGNGSTFILSVPNLR